MKAHFRLNNNVQVAMLPTTGEYCPFGKSLIAAGWGFERLPNTNFKRKHQYLWAAKQKCVDIAKCSNSSWAQDTIICAEGQKNIRDSICNGDSGGNFIFISQITF